MEIVITSRETIKPSTPTPPHLRTFKLSLIDQYQMRTVYMRAILFYSAQGDANRFETTKMSNQLKESLSKTLTQFYQVCGKLEGNESVDCNDNGLEYYEAQANEPLQSVLTSPDALKLNQLLPSDVYNNGSGFDGLSGAQVTVFSCGGIAIGLSISHAVADALSLCTFIKAWAANTKNVVKSELKVSTGFTSIFPPRDVYPFAYASTDGKPLPRHPTKRFVFDGSKIAALKAKCSNKANFIPTRVEAVSALISKCMYNALKSSGSSIIIGVPVSLRKRMSPPFPQDSFGNLAVIEKLPPWVSNDDELELHSLVQRLREMIRKVDGDYCKKLLADNAELLAQNHEDDRKIFMKQGTIFCSLSSWCGAPFYEADFGWGVPTWVTPVYVNYKNLVRLMDTKNGDGIQAWVTLDVESMARFEREPELLEFSSVNPMVDDATCKNSSMIDQKMMFP
ncbi:shikimate O-hydroxycinnamoyltransferase [Ranunculus cassubicifolius]